MYLDGEEWSMCFSLGQVGEGSMLFSLGQVLENKSIAFLTRSSPRIASLSCGIYSKGN